MNPQFESPAVLRTKLRGPVPFADTVNRPRLLTRIDAALATPLTVVSAPAGYGKSLLVGEWAERLNQPYGWVSLDRHDGEIRQFLSYCLTAIEDLLPRACPQSRAALTSHEAISLKQVTRSLTHELDQLGEPILLVLDDYHRLDSRSAVHDLLRGLFEQPPRWLHLVLITRRDPPLNVARLRAQGLLTEIRMQDLLFTPEETSEFLRRTADYEPGAAALGHLQDKIEGWAVGLRLASLALRQTEDPDSFLRNLDGGFVQIRDYLLTEAIANQPAEIRDWMLRSCIPDRFCAELLQSLGADLEKPGEPESTARQFLDRLRQLSLFVTSLDATGEWFRYHHLFQELLQRQARLHLEPDVIRGLHQRASEWFESRDLIPEAIEHSLAAGDEAHTAEIFERRRHDRLDADHQAEIEHWIGLVPEDVRHRHCQILLAEAWVSYYRLNLPRLAAILERLDEHLVTVDVDPICVAERGFFQGLMLYWDGRAAESLSCCEDALSRFNDSDRVVVGETGVYAALARQAIGQGPRAAEIIDRQLRTTDPGNYPARSRLLAALACVHLLDGDLGPAAACAGRLHRFATRCGVRYGEAWGHFPEALARLQAFRLDEALASFRLTADRRLELEHRAAVDAIAGLALTYQLLQQPDLSQATLRDLHEFTTDVGSEECIALAESCGARLALLRGRPADAFEWARSADLQPHVPSMFLWLENPAITLARVRIAEGSEPSLRAALESLDAMQLQADALHRTIHAIEIRVLRSLGFDSQRRHEDSLTSLREAVELARPGGCILPFVEGGPAVARILRRVRGTGPDEDFVDRCLAACAVQTGPSNADPVLTAEPPPASGLELPPLNALTNREIDVLELLAQRLQNSEIAARLFISDHTVSDHLKHIYQKLGVHNRRQAVDRARLLGVVAQR